MSWFVSGKVKLHFKKKSCGYPIIVLDEFGSESCAWDLNVRHFACHHRCITHNAREFPPSDVLKVLASYGRAITDYQARHQVRDVTARRNGRRFSIRRGVRA